MTIFLASLVNAFIHGWELTLVILAAMPVIEIKSTHILWNILSKYRIVRIVKARVYCEMNWERRFKDPLYFQNFDFSLPFGES